MEYNKPSLQPRRQLHHVFLVFALLCFYIICPVAPLHWADIYNAYVRFLIIGIAAVLFLNMRFGCCMEMRLVLFYTVWLFISRLLNTDLYLQNEFELIISRLLCCSVLAVGLISDTAVRRRFLDAFTAVYCGFLFAASLAGLFCCVTGSYFYLPFEDVAFGIDTYWYYKYINFLCLFSTSRTISAVWLYIAFCLMIYEFAACRRRLWRIPIAAALAVFYIGIALSYTRTIKFAVGINAAMLAVLLGPRVVRNKNAAVRLPVLALAAVLLLFAVYKSFDVTVRAVSVFSSAVSPYIDRSGDGFVHYHQDDDIDFSDPRNTGESLSTLSNRNEIYASFIPTLKDDPARIIRGCYSSKIMDIPHRYTSIAYFHMHNFLLQVFMLTGLPGFLLVLAFTVLLVIRMIRLFFSAAVSVADKLLTLPLTGLLFYGMFETLIFTASADERYPCTDIRELVFFLLAGIVLARSYEIFPAFPARKNK